MTFASGTRSISDSADFEIRISHAYDPVAADIDGASMTANEFARYQWNMRMILNGAASYADVLGDAPRNVKVAVFDRYPGHQSHPNLVNRYETGINTVEGGTNCNPPTWDGVPGGNAHGQAVASVIAAEHGATGIGGVFDRARIIPVRTSFDTMETAIDLAIAAGAEVIHIAGWEIDAPFQDYAVFPDIGEASTPPLRWNMKDETTRAYEVARCKTIREAIERAVWDYNVIVSTVVSNWSGRISTTLFSQVHECLTAGAVNCLGEASPANSSTHTITTLAPGGERRVAPWLPHAGTWLSSGFGSGQDDVPCCIGPDRYSWGTLGSFAGPHLAAAAAIVKSYIPTATAQDVRRMIVRGSQPLRRDNLHLLSANPGHMLSLTGLKAQIVAEMA